MPNQTQLRMACLLGLVCLSVGTLVAQPPGDGPRREGGGPGGPPGGGPGGFGGGPGGGPGGFGGGRRGGGFGGGGFGGGGGSPVFLLMRDNVREELKISDEQRTKIEEIQSQNRPPDFRERFANFQEMTEEERTKAREETRVEMEKWGKDLETKVKATLTSEQVTRLDQLSLHESGLSALRRPEVADSLKLREDQKKQAQSILDAYDEKMRSGGFFGGTREERDQARADRDAALDKLLTADQKTQWLAKIGPPPVVVADNSNGGGGGDRRRERGPGGPPNFTRPPSREEAVPDGATVVADLSIKPTGPETEVAVAAPSDPATTPAGPPALRGKPGEKLMSFNFRYAPWELVLKHFAEHAGLTLDLNVVPPGTFNYYDDGQFSVTEALDIINGYLLQRGYILVRRDRFLAVLNIDNGIPPNMVPTVPLSELDTRARNELVSVLIPIEGISAETAAEQATELTGPQGSVVPLTKANKVLVTDLASNVRRIRDLLGDVTGEDANQPAFRSFQLKHISVSEAEKSIRDLFGMPQRNAASVAAAAASANSSNNSRPDFSGMRDRGNWFDRGGFGGFGSDRDRDRGSDNRSSTPPPPTPTSTSSSNSRIQVAIDLRLNALMVTAKPADLKLVEQAIEAIDIQYDSDSQGRGQTGENAPQLDVYPINTADPLIVMQTIAGVVPAAIVNYDTKARRMHVFANREEQSQIKVLVEQLDGSVDGGETSLVVKLRRLDPLAVTGSLRSLFKGSRDEAPMIEADTVGRRLMIRGTTAQVVEIKTMLKQLGEDPDGNGYDPSLRGPVRTVPVGMRDPEELAELLRQIWPEGESNPIRVVVPSAPARTFRSAPNREETRLNAVPPAELKSVPAATSSPAVRIPVEKTSRVVLKNPRPTEVATPADSPMKSEETVAEWEELQKLLEADLKETEAAKSAAESVEEAASAETDIDDEAEEPAAPAEPESEPKAGQQPITIAPSGGNLIISGDDMQALDRLQQMIETLAASNSKRANWTVFYLRSADATETATILGSLFPSGSVSQTGESTSMFGSLTSGISSMGSSLMDMTGLSNLSSATTLRIVPEIRSNALFVSGPPDLVRQVEEVLEILDASELPESLRDRVPRMIAVEHADADEVHTILQDIYKDYLQPQGGGLPTGGGGMNPIAMLMAASGGGGNDKGKGRGIRLTLGVDRRTNSIVVSADESLYRQVETLIHEIDATAGDAKSTIRVVPVASNRAQLVSQALSSITGRVRVSTTGGPTRDAFSTQSSNQAPNIPGLPNGGFPGALPDFGGSRGSRGGGDDARGAIEQRMRERFLQGAGLLPPGGGDRGGRGGRGRD